MGEEVNANFRDRVLSEVHPSELFIFPTSPVDSRSHFHWITLIKKSSTCNERVKQMRNQEEGGRSVIIQDRSDIGDEVREKVR